MEQLVSRLLFFPPFKNLSGAGTGFLRFYRQVREKILYWGTEEISFGAIGGTEEFVFEGQRWVKGELVMSLARLAKHHFRDHSGKPYIAVGVQSKNKYQVRYIRPDEVVHRIK